MQTFDNSILESFRLCHARGMFRYGVGLVTPPSGGGDPTLTFGSAWHEARAAYNHILRDNWPVPESDAAFEAHLCQAAKDAFSLHWDERNAHSHRTEETAHQLLDAWHLEFYPPHRQLILIEESASIALEENISYMGKMDLLTSSQEGYALVDYKTTSRYLNDEYFNDFRMSPQLTGYNVLVESLTGEEVNLIYINAVSVRPSQTYSQLGEREFQIYPHDREEWFDRTLEWVHFINSKLPTELQGKPWAEIQAYYQARLRDGDDIRRDFLKSHVTPICKSWFRMCPYFNLCQSNLAAWRTFEFTDWLPYMEKEN